MPIEDKTISVRFNEPQLRERNRPLAMLLEMSALLSSSTDLKGVLEGALAKVLEYFEFTGGRIYLMDENEEALWLAAYQSIDIEGLERVGIAEGFSGKAARTRSFIAQPICELEDKQRAAFLLSKGFKTIVCVPLIAMGKVVGVMNLATDRAVGFDPDEIDLLLAVGNQIAVASNHIKFYEALEKKIKELKLQKEAIEFFAYSISHDLKSPAIGIYGLTKRLHRQFCEVLEGSGKLYCEQILKAAEQIVRLVDRINAYIMAKEAPLHFEPVKVKDITEVIRNEFAEVLGKRGVNWSEPESLPVIKMDRIGITRVLRNLVDNALKYGGKELREIRLEVRDEGSCFVLSIHDDGVSLSAEGSEKLFQLFQRHKTSKGVEGTGLGLATVKQIAERHRGRVWLEPAVKKGTTFSISIAKDLPEKA